ncbi:hypothetical protein POI8812_01497 [Pontivivens insulae]|uniref:Cell division protein FtsB n=1 Tax=Pontivivens insulae TaxID=1639689 RepID=A0A2R8AAY2_9RHOB|nr:septum formation initiator [Pontivivens insulae]SPF29190.1 hypothetical protein POI8812_01497 [Pontivivens insulae]
MTNHLWHGPQAFCQRSEAKPVKRLLPHLPYRALGGAVASVGVIGLTLYFCFTAVQGNHGLARLAEVRQQTQDLEVTLALLEQERAVLENRVARLSDDYLDLDLLDERARDVLGLARPDEIIIR